MAQPAPGQRMNEERIRAEIFSRNWDGKFSDGGTFLVRIAGDGAASVDVQRDNGLKFSDSGRYVPKDGKMCAFWKGIRDGRAQCFTMYRSGDIVIFNDDKGDVYATMRERK